MINVKFYYKKYTMNFRAEYQKHIKGTNSLFILTSVFWAG